MHHKLTVIAAGGKQFVARVKGMVNPRNVTEGLYLGEIEVCSPETGYTHVMVIDFLGEFVLVLLDSFNQDVGSSDALPAADFPSGLLARNPDSRAVEVG